MNPQEVLALIKKRYKPALKSKAKNELIDIICTLSMEVTALKSKIKQLEPENLEQQTSPSTEISNE
jgi:FtsZ-binding cell division protein ZapB